MKFGRVAVAQAAGSVLGHTLRLTDGRIFKKGRMLSTDDCQALERAGYREVMAARLEPGDVSEDEAAHILAETMAGEGVRVAEAFTGRCNLYAVEAGVAQVDRDRVDHVNGIDESITIATVAEDAEVQPGEMVATVKVIPFAVASSTIEACRTAATATSSAAAVIAVAPLRPHRAAFIMTRLPGTKEQPLDRAGGNMRDRLSRLGSALAKEVRCEHSEQAVAEALTAALDDGCSPILILGASAIVDRRDVVPAAIERAGGRNTHFGMPVDPGNLLLVAHCGSTPVVGVPGCARSLKPSGFDWVLRRLLAGLPVEPAQVKGRGVGGLLVDIPSRPHPRDRGRAVAVAPVIAAVVLAAGRSQRMGRQNKLLEQVEGKPMVAHVVDAAIEAGARPVVVVTGYEEEQVRAALADRGAQVAHNPDFASGMSASLRLGIDALPEVDGALVCLGDMPWVRARHLRRLMAAFSPLEGRSICVPFYDRKRGNPVLWARQYFPEMRRIEGDVGARGLLERHAESVHEVAMDDGGVLLDVDTPAALALLQGPDAR